MYSVLKKIEATNSLIVLDKLSYDKVARALKNMPQVKVSNTDNLALYEVVKYKKLIFTETSIKEFEKRIL